MENNLIEVICQLIVSNLKERDFDTKLWKSGLG